MQSAGLKVIGVAESHLNPTQNLIVDGYKWLGNNRKDIHVNAWSASGGVGFLIHEELLQDFDFNVLDDSYEGIL